MADELDGFDVLGAEDYCGVDYGPLLQAAGGAVTASVSAAEQAKKEKEASADQGKVLAAAIAADYAASEAAAKADVSAQTHAASAGIDATAAQMASAAQDAAAAAGLNADSQKKRAKSADDALAAAVAEAQKQPKNAFYAAKVKAWQVTANKAHSGAITTTGTPSGLDSYGGQSWFTRPVWGRLPGAGVLAVVGGGLVVVGVALKKYVFKKVGG